MPKGRGYVAVLRRGGDEIELGPDEVMNPDVPDEHSVIDEWSFETPYNEDLEYYRHGELLLYFEDENGNRELDQRGPVDAVKSDDSSGITHVRGHDILEYLEQSGPEGVIEADGIAAEEIDRVWGMTEFDATVHEPEGDLISEERIIQDGSLSTIFGEEISDTDPIGISDDTIVPLQTCWTAEAEEVDPANNFSDDEFSGGEGEIREAVGDFNYTFENDYVIPGGEGEVIVRCRRDAVVISDVIFDGTVLGAGEELVGGSSLGWDSFEVPFDVEPGSHTIEIDQVGGGIDSGETGLMLDVIGFEDTRYNHNRDNEVHEPGGYLDGPEELPESVEIPANIADVENAITHAYLEVECDTENNQELGIEFGPSGSFTPHITGSNTQSIQGENPGDPTSSVQGAVTLGHSGAVRDDETPRMGWDPQSLTDWELAIDETTIIVFEDQEFSGNWYQIMQEMHDEGGLIFRTIPEDDGHSVETFERGSIEGDIEWTRLEHDRGYEGMNEYCNVLTVVGGEDDTGNRPVVEVSNADEIDRIGEEIPDYVISESHETESALLNFAQVELNRRTSVDELSGTLEIVPRRLKPGYSYEVPAFDGESVVLERQTFTDGRSPSCQLEFEEIVDISTAVSSLRKETRTGRR